MKADYGKVIIFGIDGGTWNVINPFIKAGKLPNFKKLQEQGHTGVLRSTYPASTPPGWMSIFTGVTPGKHHVYDFVKRKKNSYFIEPVFSGDRTAPYLWDYAGKHGKRTIALAIPLTFPPQPLNGILTSGLGAPSKEANFAQPPEIRERILNRYPDFDVDFEEQSYTMPQDAERLKEKISTVTKTLINVARDMFAEEKWDIFSLVFRSIDVVQHDFWDDADVIYTYLKQVDESLGWFMEQVKKDTLLIVVSDHGFQKMHTKFYINDWLCQNGYLTLSPPKKSLLNADALERMFIRAGLRNLLYWLKKQPFLEFLVKHVASSTRIALTTRAIWEKTTLYYLGISYNGLIYANVAGREPQGIVPPADVYRIYKDVKAKLGKLTYKGQKVVDEVLFGDSVYTFGPDKSGRPDIVITLKDGFVIANGLSETGSVFEPNTDIPGNHHINGMFGLYGTFVKSAKVKKDANVTDITPTTLKALGLPLSTFLDGKPLL